MEENLAEALEVLFGKSRRIVEEESEEEKSTTELIEEAQSYYDLIEDSMKKGDWAGIGDSFDKLGRVIDKLE